MYVLIEKGVLDLYISYDSQAIKVVTGRYGEHVVLVDNVSQVELPRSYVVKDSTLEGSIVQKATVDGRLLIVIPHTTPGFQIKKIYFTVFAQKDSEFFFYFRQDLSSLNLPVFVGMFICSFLIAFSIALFSWKSVSLVQERARVVRRRKEQAMRKGRPYERITVLLHNSTCRFSQSKNPSGDDKTTTQSEKHLCTEIARLHANHADFKPSDHRRRKTSRTSKSAIPLKNSTLLDEENSDKCQTALFRVDPDNLSEWPVSQQPCRDGMAVVSTVLVQYPSKCSGSALGIGAALFHTDRETGTHLQNGRTRKPHLNATKVRVSPTAETLC